MSTGELLLVVPVMYVIAAIVMLVIAIRSDYTGTFREGDLVICRRFKDPTKQSIPDWIVSEFGSGPYRVTKAQLLEPSEREGVGHQQTIEIVNFDGEPMRWFSGYWFRKVRKA